MKVLEMVFRYTETGCKKWPSGSAETENVPDTVRYKMIHKPIAIKNGVHSVGI